MKAMSCAIQFLGATLLVAAAAAVAQTASNTAPSMPAVPKLDPLTRDQIANLKVAPETDDDSDDDQSLEDMFVQRSSIGTMTIRGYKTCRDTMTGRLMIACGARTCPGGTEMVAWSPETHPNCNVNPACVDMKDLGWKSGHKNRFCTSRGYDGVKPRAGKYRNGGWCFKGNGCG